MTIDKKAEELLREIFSLYDTIGGMFDREEFRLGAESLIASAFRAERQEAAERGLRAYDMLPTETVANYDYCRRALRDAIIKEA